MRRRLGMLFYRVARWLVPEYFCNRLQTIAEMQARRSVLRARYESMSAKARNSIEGQLVLSEMTSLQSMYESAAKFGAEQYEQVKVEIAQITKISAKGQKRFIEGEDIAKIHAEETKAALFAAVAKGFAESAEIEKFMYNREYGAVKTVGIRLYLKHDK